jgi:ASC-1-like (ASCH) protein
MSDHVAIMKKSWGLVPKIYSGKKKIESRWYKNKSAPWGKIKNGDVVYFKNSGEPVSVKTKVEKVISFSGLTPQKVRDILNKYGKEDGIEKDKIPDFFKLFKDKKYCLLIFLNNPKQIEPFEINKIGFGMMSAWLVVEKIDKIKIPIATRRLLQSIAKYAKMRL